MHELGLMDEVVAAVASAVDGARVTRVRLEVGRLAAVVPDALRFCFEVCSRGTLLEGATLEIEEVVGRGRCRACTSEIQLEDVLSLCPCGSPDYEVLSGHLVRVRDVEVIDVRDLRLR
jgi:hydrogenase nickel incorporation protein HypA/HybF